MLFFLVFRSNTKQNKNPNKNMTGFNIYLGHPSEKFALLYRNYKDYKYIEIFHVLKFKYWSKDFLFEKS